MKIYNAYTPEMVARLTALSPTMRQIFETQSNENVSLLERLLVSLEKLDAQNKETDQLIKSAENKVNVVRCYLMATNICLELFGITAEMIGSDSKKRMYVECRNMISSVLYPRFTQKSIGRLMGGRDHSTIINQLQNHNDWIITDAEYRKAFTVFKESYDELFSNLNNQKQEHSETF